MVEFRKIFLKKTRLLLACFVEFFKDSSILVKNYLNNYVVKNTRSNTNYYDYI